MTNRQMRRLQIAVVELSGDARRVLAALGIERECEPYRVHDFIVASPRRMWQLMRSLRDSFVVVATKDLRYQRFRTIWKLYAAAAGMWRWMFADERGCTDRFRWSKLLAVELPLLAAELVLSLFALGVGAVRLVAYRVRCR